MSFEVARGCRRLQQAQVIQVLEQVETILAAFRILAIVIDVNLWLYLQTVEDIFMIDVIVVVCITHHLLQIVVVSHADRHMVRICLAQVCLGIVSQPILILIEIERIYRRCIFYAIDMAFSIRLFVKQLPTATGDFVSTRCYVWLRH